jgi:hypothetical protein
MMTMKFELDAYSDMYTQFFYTVNSVNYLQQVKGYLRMNDNITAWVEQYMDTKFQ